MVPILPDTETYANNADGIFVITTVDTSGTSSTTTSSITLDSAWGGGTGDDQTGTPLWNHKVFWTDDVTRVRQETTPSTQSFYDWEVPTWIDAPTPTALPTTNWVRLKYTLQPKLSPREKLKRKIQDQLQPVLAGEDGRGYRAAAPSADFTRIKQNEIVALQLMKKLVDKDRWKKYLRYGFVDVAGKSGMIYQILRGQDHVRVFKRGTLVCELCVRLKSRMMPPTDEVITRMIIAECDEPDLWKRANVYMKGPLSGPRCYTEAALDLVARQVAA